MQNSRSGIAAARPSGEPSLITAATLKSYSLKELATMAQRRGVSRWKTMKKDELIRALARANAKAAAKPAAKPKAAPAAKPAPRPAVAKKAAAPARPAKPTSPRVVAKLQKARETKERSKDLSGPAKAKGGAPEKDRVVLMVRDPFWLHAVWNVTRHSVSRAEAALAEQWHTAKPILRLLLVDHGSTTSSAERIAREIDVHGGVTNWYIDVANPSKSYRVELGYKAANGKFHALSRSNTVTMPVPGSSDAIDKNWEDVADNYERVYALSGGYSEETSSGELQELFEERLRRPMGGANGSRYGLGAEGIIKRNRDFQFHVDAEMIVYGSSKPDARVTVGGEPIKIRPDGTFTLRLAMPDKRQVIPVVAASADGVEQRTVVLAVERNTKVLEPMVKESQND